MHIGGCVRPSVAAEARLRLWSWGLGVGCHRLTSVANWVACRCSAAAPGSACGGRASASLSAAYCCVPTSLIVAIGWRCTWAAAVARASPIPLGLFPVWRWTNAGGFVPRSLAGDAGGPVRRTLPRYGVMTVGVIGPRLRWGVVYGLGVLSVPHGSSGGWRVVTRHSKGSVVGPAAVVGAVRSPAWR